MPEPQRAILGLNVGLKSAMAADAADKQEHDEAYALYNEVLAVEPRNQAALLGAARSLRLLGRRGSEARHLLNRALFLWPDDPDFRAELAELEFAAHNPGSALELWDALLKSACSTEASWVGKLSCLRILNKEDQFDAAVAEALRAQPQSSRVRTQAALLKVERKQFDAAAEIIASAIDKTEFLDLAQRIDLKNSELLDALESRFPQDCAVLAAIAAARLNLRQVQRGLAASERVLALEPDNTSALDSKIRALITLRKFEGAEQFVSSVLSRDATSSEVRSLTVDLLAAAGKYDQAVEVLGDANSVLEFSPQYSVPDWAAMLECALLRWPGDIALLRALSLAYEGSNRIDVALQACDQILEIKEDDRSALFVRIRLLRELSRLDEAKDAAEALVREEPERTDLREELSRVYIDQKDYRKAAQILLDADLSGKLADQVRGIENDRGWPDARRLIDEGLKIRPDDKGLLKLSGDLYIHARFFEKAAPEFEYVAIIAPEDNEAILNRAFCLRVLRRFDEASKLLDEINTTNRWEFDAIRLQRGWLEFAQSHYREAEAIFASAWADDDRAVDGRLLCRRELRDYEGSLQLIDEVWTKVARKELLWSHRGEVFLAQEKLEQAVNAFSEACSWASKPEYQIRKATVLARLQRYDEAQAALRELPSRHINLVHQQLAWLHMDRNNFVLAKQECESIADSLDMATAKSNTRGAIHFALGEYEAAEREFRKVLKAEGFEAYSHNNVAWSIVRGAPELRQNTDEPKGWRSLLWSNTPTTASAAKARLSEAEQLCRRALDIYPGYAAAENCLGIIAYKRGRLLEAESHFKSSIRMSLSEGSHSDLGSLYVQMGRYKKAKEVLLEACRLSPADSQCRITLGDLYLQTKKPTRALQILREAVSVAPHDESAVRALALAHLRAGDFTEAVRVLQRGLRVFDVSKRWTLHLTLCQALTEMAEKNDDTDLYSDALENAHQAIMLRRNAPEPYFYAGVVRFKQQDWHGARKNFSSCLALDRTHFDAKQNLRRVKAVAREQGLRSRAFLILGIALGVFCVLSLISVWVLYFDRPDKVTTAMVSTLSPILLGLVFVAFLLPYVAKLKLPGVEAELSQPKEKIAMPPSGSVGFGSTPVGSGPR